MGEGSFKQVALSVRDVCYSYNDDEQILKGINLTVEKNGIYGLLGSSGCGKTTLLKCIMNRLKVKSGDIEIFGLKPGSPESHIPGAGVGYMPQELGLYFDFTINEILTYFGRIYAMNRNEIKEKVERLIKLLELKNKNKTISKLSGGQQRRVSLACALIHDPPLLILDEPTVGIDPVLRQSIWLHLISLTQSGHTIILTTHYIEETRTAKTVAFMRNGKILAEENPDVLLEKYKTDSLEDAILKICHSENKLTHNITEIAIDLENHAYQNIISEEEEEEKEREKEHKEYERRSSLIGFVNNLKRRRSSVMNPNEIKEQVREISIPPDPNNNPVNCISIVNLEDNKNNIQIVNNFSKGNALLTERKYRYLSKCSALLIKNFKRITRNWGHLLFELVFSTLLLLMIMLFIGDGPTNLNVAVFDEEIVNNVTSRWGELFIEKLDKKRFNTHYFNSFEEGMDSVRTGENHVLIEINDRFTKALRLKFIYMTETDEDTLEESQLFIHVDRANQMVGLQIEAYLYHAMLDFIKDAANRTNIDPAALTVPLVFEEPVYGKPKESLREFVIPGAYIVLQFFTTTIVTGHLILDERKDGLLERSLVAGITVSEYLVSNILTQIPILFCQLFFIVLLPKIFFARQITGSFTLFATLTLSQGFCGVTFGIVIAILVSDAILASLIVVFTFFLAIITGGVLWPVENMPQYIQSFTMLLPNSASVEAMRSILYRGWTIDYHQVYMGFISTYIWAAIFLIVAMFFLKRTF